MECKQELNKENCTCTSFDCSRRGICCECLRHHLKKRQLPGCCFPEEAEATHDRSFEFFMSLVKEKKI